MSSNCVIVHDILRKKLSSRVSFPARFFSRNGYEKSFCDQTSGIYVTKAGDKRYWDCLMKDVKVELKKSKTGSYWLDEVRYSEILLAKMRIDYKHRYFHQASQNTVTLFMRTKKSQLFSIHVVDTNILIQNLSLSKKDARYLINRHQKLLRKKERLNSQHSIKTSCLDRIAKFILYFSKSKPKKPPTKKKRSRGTTHPLKPQYATILRISQEIANTEGIFTKRDIDAKIQTSGNNIQTFLTGKHRKIRYLRIYKS